MTCNAPRLPEPKDDWPETAFRRFCEYNPDTAVVWQPARPASGFVDFDDVDQTTSWLVWELEQTRDSDIEIAAVHVYKLGAGNQMVEVKDSALAVDAEQYLTGSRLEKAKAYFEEHAEYEHARSAHEYEAAA